MLRYSIGNGSVEKKEFFLEVERGIDDQPSCIMEWASVKMRSVDLVVSARVLRRLVCDVQSTLRNRTTPHYPEEDERVGEGKKEASEIKW